MLRFRIQILIFFLFVVKAQGQNWNQILKTASSTRLAPTSASRTSNDNFGNSVAIDGDYAVIGAYKEDQDALGSNTKNNAGSAVVLQNIAGVWTQVKKLVANDRDIEDNFGGSVAIHGNTIVVGAFFNGSNPQSGAGAVYVYSRDFGGANNWGQVKKLTSSEVIGKETFGSSVAVNNNTIIVGANQDGMDALDNNFINNAGAAYIFKKDQGGINNWGLVRKIVASDRSANDYFGYSVAINNSTIIVGAYLEDEDNMGINPLANAGSVYIFEENLGGVDNWGQLKKIVAGDRGTDDFFGISIAINGDLIVVGASQEDHDISGLSTASEAGSAYIFSRDQGGLNNWGQIKKVTANDRAQFDFFGASVAISGSRIVIGAVGEDQDASGINTVNGAGSAYIFYKDQGGIDNWGQERKIVALDRGINDIFGISVAISENSIIIGARDEDEDVQGINYIENAGSTYIFNRDLGGNNNWGQKQKVVFKDVYSNQNFGYSVSIDGDFAVVGAIGDATNSIGQQELPNAGAAFILQNIGGIWKEVKKIVPTDRAIDDRFGQSVAISGNTVVVGAPFEDQDALGLNTFFNAGSAYIFSKNLGGENNWGELKKVVASDRSMNDNFGQSVAINNNIIVIGAYLEREDASGANSFVAAGSVYLFSIDQGGINNWGQLKKIVANDRSAFDYFGNSVAISGDNLVVGAYQEDHDGNGLNSQIDAGSVYLFQKNQGGINNWGQLKKIVASDRAVDDHFGFSVTINENTLAVGANTEDEDVNEANTKQSAGSVYIFSKDFGGLNNWGQVKKVVPNERATFDYFGSSVSISNNILVVGAFTEDEDEFETNTGDASGSAYIFKKDLGGNENWGLVKKIVAADRGINGFGDNFGFSVAISGSTIIVGAISDNEDTNGISSLFNRTGSAYFYKDCQNFNIAVGNSINISKQNNNLTNYYDNNCGIINTILPNGNNPLNGTIINKVWIEPINSSNFVKRHYEISPLTNQNTATGKITLYFTQDEFNEYNNLNAIDLPSNPTDTQGKLNLRIMKYSGTSNDGSGLPHTYTSTSEYIDVIFSDILWNEFENRWEVSFNTNGFGGYFLLGINTNNCNYINYTLSSGDWEDSTIWSCGHTPSPEQEVVIKNLHQVHLQTTISIKKLILEVGSALFLTNAAVLNQMN